MSHGNGKYVVETLMNKCRVCYTCVRECPAKAIKIINGQAEVLGERCIACGNCVKVCSQGAKIYVSNTNELLEMLDSNDFVIAAVAPSFPAEFDEFDDPRALVPMLRDLGFKLAVEVGFGADAVAQAYQKLQRESDQEIFISSDCPAIVYYIEQYYPKLVSSLARVASPMVAMTRYLKEKYAPRNPKVVFIGPCIAKKAESNEVDCVITFQELRQVFNARQVTYEAGKITDFDPPHAAKGAVFPVSKGMLHTMGLHDDLLSGDVVVAEGKQNVREVIQALDSGEIKARHVELLSCEGCIMGPGMSPQGKRYQRKAHVANYVASKLARLDWSKWQVDLDFIGQLDMSQSFQIMDRRSKTPTRERIDHVLAEMGKYDSSDHLNCGACGYSTCEKHAMAIIDGLAEIEMCLPYAIEKLHQSLSALDQSNHLLDDAKRALKHQEKLANMGQLSAGIAHELNNPLGVITMYSNILLDELAQDDPTRNDVELIAEQADRCKKIVGGLLNFARKNQLQKSEYSLVEFCKQSLQSVVVPDNVQVEFSSDVQRAIAFFDYDQMMQVLTNLEKNAIEAMPHGGTLSVHLKEHDETFEIRVSDNGTGISPENMDKIFTPFFTTKGIGKGTGLGLPLVYGIIKMHHGKIEVETNNQPEKGPTGTHFIIHLPK